MAQRIALTGLILLVLALMGCDHATKVVARTHLASSDPVTLVPGVLDLRYVQNEDTAFSLTHSLSVAHKPVLLATCAALGLAATLLLARRRYARAGSRERVAFALVLAGGAGNVVDRVGRGYVVDFIHLNHWPVFNVADVFIVVGAIVLLVAAARRGRGALVGAGP